jgi:hypothetical protein
VAIEAVREDETFGSALPHEETIPFAVSLPTGKEHNSDGADDGSRPKNKAKIAEVL